MIEKIRDYLTRQWSTFVELWESMKPPQKLTIVALVILLVGSLVWTITTTTASPMTRIVGPDESRETRAQVKQKLDEKRIPYKIVDDAILVNKEDADKVVLDLAVEGVFSDQQIFKFLDQVDFTSTRWTQEKRWLVAIQRKLEQMIRTVDAIKDVRIVINPSSERTTVLSRADDGTASVTITTKPGKSLDKRQLMGIANIVAAGARIPVKNVKIMDAATMRVLRIPGDEATANAVDIQDLERDYDLNREEKVKNVLKSMVQGFGDVAVSVTTKISKKSKETFKNTVSEGAETENQKTKKSSSSKIPGTEPGAKGQSELPAVGGTISGTADESTISTKTSPSVVQEKEVAPSGDLEDVTVAAVVIIYEDSGVTVQSIEPMRKKMEEQIMAAAQLKDPKKMSLAIVPSRRAAEAMPVETTGDKIWAFIERNINLIIITLITLVILVIIYRMIKSSMEKLKVLSPEEITKAVEVVKEEEEVEVPEEIHKVRSGIKDAIEKNPRTVASILKRWATQ